MEEAPQSSSAQVESLSSLRGPLTFFGSQLYFPDKNLGQKSEIIPEMVHVITFGRVSFLTMP